MLPMLIPATLPLGFLWRLCGPISVSLLVIDLRKPSHSVEYEKDYMYERQVFTNDPQYFPLTKVREIVIYLHKHDQQYSGSNRHSLHGL